MDSSAVEALGCLP